MIYKICSLVLALLLASTMGWDPELKRCQQQCKDQIQHEGRGHGPDNLSGLPKNDEIVGIKKKREGKGQNPYVFEDRHFSTVWKTEHGTLRILQKFTERLNVLRGIEKFRLAVVEAQPQTFLLPNHWDADIVGFVVNGKGTVSSVYQEKRESFNVKEGDIFRLRAGTTTYLINSDNNEKIVLVGLVKPVNNPGEVEAFFGAAGENPESFYKAFSNEILEASFNTTSARLEGLFGQQKEGAIIRASEEEIRGMSGHTKGGIWPFGGESKGKKHSLYEPHPSYSNQYGQQYEVDSNQFKQLGDLDVAVSLANISRGAMTAPNYSSRATKIMTVVNGEGYFEMVGSAGYRKIRSNLKTGTVVVVPAGHPYVVVASKNRNLKLLCFQINTYNNKMYTLAGKGNVINQLEKEAKELAFGVPVNEVDGVFNSQQDVLFFRGPQQQG